MGLLSKAGHLDYSEELAFSDFFIKYNLSFAAFFDRTGAFFTITNSIGFDGVSIITSESTEDFWNGICDNQMTPLTFSAKESTLTPFFQLFSFAQKDELEEVTVVKVSSERIFMVCNQVFPSSCLKDLACAKSGRSIIKPDAINHMIKRDSKVLKIEVEYSEAAESFIHSQVKGKEKEALFCSSLDSEIANRFLCFFAKNVSAVCEPYRIRAIFVVTRALTTEHLINHIILNLRGVIGKHAEIINFDFKGTAVTLADINSFLQGNA